MAAGEAGAQAGEKYKPLRGGVPTFASAPATQPAKGWSLVAGPMGAAVMALLQAGWVPEAPGEWVSRSGALFRLVEGMEINQRTCQDLLVEFRKDILESLWCKAAGGRHGGGINGIPDLGAVFK
eukprot:3587313-Lingulodinium_polyedra.AAC.1